MDPHAGGLWKSNIPQFVHQSEREDGVECGALVHEKKPHTGPLLLQMGSAAWRAVATGSICPVGKVVEF